jgi:hypothetical protein
MASTSAGHLKHFPVTASRPAVKSRSTKSLALVSIVLVVAALAVGAYAMRPHGIGGGNAAATPEAFVEQLETIAKAGGGTSPHVFGGTIRTERNGSMLALVADNVPPTACVSVGWKLVRKGLLSINGTMPTRVSAAKLADLCNQEEGAAVLTWIPRPAQ